MGNRINPALLSFDAAPPEAPIRAPAAVHVPCCAFNCASPATHAVCIRAYAHHADLVPLGTFSFKGFKTCLAHVPPSFEATGISAKAILAVYPTARHFTVSAAPMLFPEA